MSRRAALSGLAAWCLVAALALPLYLAFVASLTPEAELFERLAWMPHRVVLAHYEALFRERAFWLPIRNSLVVAGATSALSVAFGALAAYAIARMRFPGRRILLAGLLAVALFPPIAIVSPLYLVLRSLRLIDTYAGLVLPYLAFAMPLAVWLMSTALAELPRELEEAAWIDGASRLRALREVVLPLVAPALATTAILTFLMCWNEFLFALSFTLGPERQTVPVAIALFRGQYRVPWGEILAAATLATLPVAAVVFLFQRRIVRGLTAGAVKG